MGNVSQLSVSAMLVRRDVCFDSALVDLSSGVMEFNKIQGYFKQVGNYEGVLNRDTSTATINFCQSW